MTAIAARPVTARLSLSKDLHHAVAACKHAASLVRTVMADGRLGKAVEVEKVGAVVESITGSILGNSGALLGLLHIENKPRKLDLSKGLGFGGADKIIRHESPQKWNVNPVKFMSIAS